MTIIKQIVCPSSMLSKNSIDLCLFKTENSYYVKFNNNLSIAFNNLNEANEAFEDLMEGN